VTGMRELRTVRAMSAAPEAIRVSVVGGRTQLDVALPADVPVAAFLPELARLIGSRDTRPDEDVVDRDERRTFWVLTRVDGDTALGPEETLRGAGVENGELLRISAQQALSPPTLYDDVVDAAARLNRASYASWNATAAAVMAFAGLWLCTAAWMYFLVADALSADDGDHGGRRSAGAPHPRPDGHRQCSRLAGGRPHRGAGLGSDGEVWRVWPCRVVRGPFGDRGGVLPGDRHRSMGIHRGRRGVRVRRSCVSWQRIGRERRGVGRRRGDHGDAGLSCGTSPDREAGTVRGT